ncbi:MULTISPECIES: SusC/RagA family TonB-linked outer membrane protein [Parabacteroides]|jgi:TonB-linked SusC/RagA family outer membrane protein|uniref:SusC/RagA family TonB-linked outer membrane protein n=1 Tax=Parabacteroides gordonii MS-1 = DSM 23371 TaxID=1203610 RepID=A0A0F5JJR0_9BACT|nr:MULTISPECIES: TonB-dependent receptor [Parabacteroides]KKB46773.1 SusC/RagA family TonB-linked outer membrane protein [Parabacteroides sp. HGS0025]KKB57954.1 SusC/RagA family TonB-linked outer membrane protein [Parabacteroides gordonii MS-1 = DSM 23371]MCA5582857.1 TonB-dependent receptor [Parabacteroides gordonii]RGP17470.1 TonB-dependent receptor [Parabacteroides gordonii]
MKKNFLILVLVMLLPAFAWGQEQITITGTVMDESNFSVPGASIVEKGTTNGTVTDLDGNFSIIVSNKNAILQFSFIGYKTQEVPLAGKTKVNVILREDAEQLDEVVVTGYGGQQKRATLTTAISKLDNRALENVAISNAGQSLQGTVSGLRVVNTSGKPGEAPNIVLRGGATITGDPANNQALVVVDGIVRSMNDVNPADIESIQVLKDAASTAIYGARANSGVILVTTKRAKEGKATVSYKFKGGMNFARKGYEFLGARDFLYYNRLGNKYINDAGYTRTLQQVNNTTGYGTNAGNHFSVHYLTDENKHLLNEGWEQMTDPYDGEGQLIFKDYGGQMMDAAFNDPSFTQDHYFSVTGGNDKATFLTSFGYYNEQGQVVGTSYERFTGNINGSYKVRDNIKINAGATYSFSKKPGLWISEAQLFYRSMSLWPTLNPYDEDGNPAAGVGSADGNPLYWKDKLQRINNVRRTTFNIGGSWEIIPGLALNENSSIYYIDNEQEDFDKQYQTQNSSTPNNTRNARGMYERQFQQQHSATLTYNKSFIEKHNLDAMIGGEYFDYNRFKLQAKGNKAPSDDIPTLNGSSDKTEVYSYKDGYRMLSGFARVNYNYEYKYLFSVVARYDGISKLSDNRWGFFPGVSAGWNLHEESFFKDTEVAKYVSTVKPRVSYGVNGNVAGLGNYEVYGEYNTINNSSSIPIPYNGNVGFLNTGLINSDLRWEKSNSFEVGLDLGFINNRFNLILDYYNRTTSDLLTSLELPGYTGFSNIRTNLGSLRNTGFEAEVKLNILSNPKAFSWDFSFNTSLVHNKIIKLPYNGNENNRQGGMEVYDPKSGKVTWVGGYQEGQPLGEVYAYKQERIFKDWDDVKANAGDRYDAVAELYGPNKWAQMSDKEKIGKKPIEPGDVMWADLDNNGVINEYDRVKVGNVLPKWTGGFSTNLSYKDISLFARFDYALGHIIYNDLAARSLGQYQGSFNIIKDVYNTWSPENVNADLPKFYYADQLGKKNITRSNNANPNINNNSSRFYEKGDYLALREITLSYRLPKKIIEKATLSDASIYITGQNLFYITGYTGMSPEPAVKKDNAGVDEGRYPMPRTVLLGVSVSF